MAIEPRVPARSWFSAIFPEQVLSIDATSIGGGIITQSGSTVSSSANDGQSYAFNCTLSEGYKIGNVVYNASDGSTLIGYTDNSFTIMGGMGGIGGTATISVAQIGPKAVSLEGLQTFKGKCDETYANKTEIPEEYTLPVANASTLGGVKPVAKTSEMTQNVGVDSNGALYTKPAPDISEQVSDLSQSVDDIYTILQQEVYNAQDIEQEYSSRETADGADIIDGALETVKKIQGATVKTTNLLNVTKTIFDTNNKVTYNPETYTFTITEGTVGISESAYHFDIPIPAGTKVSTYIEFSQGQYTDGDFSVGGYNVDEVNGSSWQGKITIPLNQDLSGRHFSTAFTTTKPVTDFWLFVNAGTNVTTDCVFRIVFNIGDTVDKFIPYFPGLKNAYFQGLRSTGRNLLKLNDGQYNVVGVSVDISNGQVTFSGTSTGSGGRTIWLSDGFMLPAGTYFLSCTPGLDSSNCIGYISDKNDFTAIGSTVKGNFTLDKATEVGFGFNFLSVGMEYSGTYTIMLNRGDSALPYEPYIAHEISLDTAIELPAWDSINPTTGKRIVGTNTVYLDEIDDWTVSSNEYEGKTAFRAGTYPNIVVHTSQNPKAICSRLPFSYTIATNKSAGEAWAIANSTNYIYVSIFNSRLSSLDSAGLKAYFTQERNAGNPYVVSFIVEPTESDISMEDRLPAYKNGSETVIQGATDNSKYGAENTLTQNYAEVKGTTKGGNS